MTEHAERGGGPLQSTPPARFCKPQHSGKRFAVVNLVLEDHVECFGEWNQMTFNRLVSFRLRVPCAQVACKEDGHRLVEESRTCEEMKDLFPTLGAIARFLDQFALGAGQGILARIDAACWQLPQVLL